jgi:hypothetical protein
MISSRVPRYEEPTFKGMKKWFKMMAKRGLLFHPDDAPDQIISTRTGQRMFCRDECLKLESIIGKMFKRFGDKVYTAAYPVFMKEFRTLIKR